MYNFSNVSSFAVYSFFSDVDGEETTEFRSIPGRGYIDTERGNETQSVNTLSFVVSECVCINAAE